MDWSEVQSKDPIYLNLGGDRNYHPKRGYESYVSVDLRQRKGWSVKHDLRQPIPLPDGTVTRIHTEDCLEHLHEEDIKKLLVECYRLLKKGGRMRIAVPDYNNPRNRARVKNGRDPKFKEHLTLTNCELVKELIEQSPFKRYQFYHFWVGDYFVHRPIDYSLGWVKRTPENDPRNRRRGVMQKFFGHVRDFLYRLVRGFKVTSLEMLTRRGHALHATSVVVDLFKDE